MSLPMAPPCGCMLRVHPVSVSLCLPPWVCLMPACRPCHVSHTEPNAINVSAHGAALWRRGHRRPGGPGPQRPPQHPARQHQQHVSHRSPTPARQRGKYNVPCTVYMVNWQIQKIHIWTLRHCLFWFRLVCARCVQTLDFLLFISNKNPPVFELSIFECSSWNPSVY